MFFSEHKRIVFLTAIGISVFVIYFLRRKKFGFDAKKVLFVTLTYLVFGYLSARYIFPFLEAFGNVSKMAGYRIYGAIFVAPFFFLCISKAAHIDYRQFSDYSILCFVSTLMISRVECFFNGCCYGVKFFDTAFRWPIRELELLLNAAFLAFFIPKILKEKTHGEVYPIYMIFYGVIRFILECFRVEYDAIGTSGYHLAHIWSILSVLIGAAMLIAMDERRKSTHAKREK